MVRVIHIDGSSRSRLSVIGRDVPIDPWGDGAAFLDRPLQSSQIFLSDEDDVVIENLRWEDRPYVSGQGNAHVCILLSNCTNITVRNCDFQNIAEAVAIFGGSNITIQWCRANEVRGPSQPRVGFQTGNFSQTVNSPSNVSVIDNKIKVKGPTEDGLGDTEDIISMYSCNGGLVARNQIDGSGWFSTNGTGIIAGDGGGDNVTIEDNTLLNPGQVGIAIAGGIDHLVQRNVVYQWQGKDTEYVGDSNVGMYAFDFSSEGWSGHEFRDNRVRFWSDIADTPNGLWNPDGFPTIDNNFNDDTIDPADLAVVL